MKIKNGCPCSEEEGLILIQSPFNEKIQQCVLRCSFGDLTFLRFKSEQGPNERKPWDFSVFVPSSVKWATVSAKHCYEGLSVLRQPKVYLALPCFSSQPFLPFLCHPSDCRTPLFQGSSAPTLGWQSGRLPSSSLLLLIQVSPDLPACLSPSSQPTWEAGTCLMKYWNSASWFGPSSFSLLLSVFYPMSIPLWLPGNSQNSSPSGTPHLPHLAKTQNHSVSRRNSTATTFAWDSECRQ